MVHRYHFGRAPVVAMSFALISTECCQIWLGVPVIGSAVKTRTVPFCLTAAESRPIPGPRRTLLSFLPKLGYTARNSVSGGIFPTANLSCFSDAIIQMNPVEELASKS